MKLNKLRVVSVVLKTVFIIFCCCSITVKAEAGACQAERCNHHQSRHPYCGDGDCSGGYGGSENHFNCPKDCSSTASCGDGVISNGETCFNCPADAGSCGSCGDGVCNCAPIGTETSSNCLEDCGSPITTTTTTVPQDCGSPTTTTSTTVPFYGCGDGVCSSATENSVNCIEDCPCPSGSHQQVGAATGCCVNGQNFVINGACSVCSAATPYLYPTNNRTYNNLGWAGACRRCPETAPWEYNGTCHNCSQTEPYVLNGSCTACNMITKVSLQYLGYAQLTNGNGISYNTNASGNSCASSLVNAALAYADSLTGRGDKYYDDKVVDFLHNAAISTGGCTSTAGHWKDRCINGTWYLDRNCNPISPSSLPATCGESQITAVVTTQFYDSSPISLIMDNKLNIDSDVTITSFAVNPNEFGKWYSWKASAKAPLLVYDPIHTGVVNSATQLFGNWTFGGRKLASLLPSFHADKIQWENGYQALATLDANGDQKISAEELSPLALWFDVNRDGKSQAGEVKAISEVGITALYFTPDRVDKNTASIYATLGYERVVAGKSVTGSSVDWYATKANNPQSLIADRMLRNLNQSEKTDQLSERSKDSNYASAPEKSGISGVWGWDFNLANANHKNPKGVLMFGSVNGNSLKGLSFSSSELQTPVNEIAHIAKVYNLEGTISKDQDGQEKIVFTSSFAGAKINSQAALSKDGSTLEGSSSVVSNDRQGKAETITYQWTAVRYSKK